VDQARAKGFEHVAVACEPTGPRWLQVQQLCAGRGLPLVCIQPLVSRIAREQQDDTPHKTDEADCVMIARLAAELHCYLPEQLDETWAHLRHLGRRRAQLITAATASVQRIRDLLSVAWPTVTEACAQPLESVTWLAAVQVVTSRCGGQPGRLAGMGPRAFTALVRGTVPGWGGQRVGGKICDRIFAALTDTEGVVVSCRRGLLRRCADELGDLQRTRAQLRAVEADMVAVLAGLGLSRLADIPGLTAGRRRGDLGRDRRPAPLRQLLLAGQARRAVPLRQLLRRLLWRGPDFPPWPARPAADRLARGVAPAHP